MDRFLAAGGLTAVALHEIAHVLGFGPQWDDLGLLVNPSGGLDEVVDTHFTGPAARAAFECSGRRPDLAPRIAENVGPAIELGDDIWRVPLQIVNEHGRGVRVIPPR